MVEFCCNVHDMNTTSCDWILGSKIECTPRSSSPPLQSLITAVSACARIRIRIRIRIRVGVRPGKLRVLYEGFPMALIIEQAGGSASTGMFNGSIGRVLEIEPKDIHERCPIIIGNPSFVDKVTSEYTKA